MKQLLISALLLISCPVWGATALDFAAVNDEIVQNVTSATYVDAATTLTFTPAGSSSYMIWSHVSIEVSNVDTIYSVQLNHDTGDSSGVIWEYDSDQSYIATGASGNFDCVADVKCEHYGQIWNMQDQKSLTAISQTFSIEVKRTAGTGNVEVENASIVVMEFDATRGMEYAEVTTLQDTGTSTSDETVVTLSFTATAEQYVAIMAGQFGHEDNSTGSGWAFKLGGIIRCDENSSERDGTNNNEAADPSPILKSYSGGCMSVDTHIAETVSYIITIDGAGIADEMFMQRGSIFAMPSAQFEAFGFDRILASRSGSYVGIAGTGFQDDSEMGTITQTLAAKTHLFGLSVCGATEAGSNQTEVAISRISVDGTGHMESATRSSRDEDSSGSWWCNWVMYTETFGAECTSCVTKPQLASSSDTGTREAKFKWRALFLAEIPEAAVGGARRHINITMGAE